jgi:hypothetical protein
MGNNIVQNTNNIDNSNFYRTEILCEKRVSSPEIVNISFGAERNFFGSLRLSVLLKKPLLRLIFSVFYYSVFSIKVIVLSAISLTYFIIGAMGVILYLIFYEKLFKTLVESLKIKRKKSPYYFKWKKHHLELDYEV